MQLKHCETASQWAQSLGGGKRKEEKMEKEAEGKWKNGMPQKGEKKKRRKKKQRKEEKKKRIASLPRCIV